MSAAGCRQVWSNASHNQKSEALDAAYPNCFCEEWSLVSDAHSPIEPAAKLARILTTPGMYDAGDLVSQKLTSANAGGLSLIRSGASDDEILGTITILVHEAAEPQSLLGAAVFDADLVRAIGRPDRHFGIYHTPDHDKQHHADLLAVPPTGTNSAIRKAKSDRRSDLKAALMPTIIFESDAAALLNELRSQGI